MARPWFIATSGLMGAGKTTLARGLASLLGWMYLPAVQPALKRLRDLFSDPSRWAFETQTAFLANKALQLRHALSTGVGVVLDRTLDEDAFVFAEYFRRNGQLDDRSFETYGALSRYFFETLPAPDLVILCSCPIDVSRQRSYTRGAGAHQMYPPGYFDDIALLYDDWRNAYDRSDLYSVDTVAVDTRTKKSLDGLSRTVTDILAQRGHADTQFDLFESESMSARSAGDLRLLRSARERPETRPAPRAISPEIRVTRFPSAYLAAPFTAFAQGSQEGSGALNLDLPHGTLEDGPYRQFLLSIERALRKYGISTLIPHRDINVWGNRKLPSEEVLRLCSEYVHETDMFVGVLGSSHGSHYEFGLAVSLGRPCLLIRTRLLPESFIASGITNQFQHCHVLTADALTDVEAEILSPETRRFLERYLPLAGGRS